MAWIAGFLMGVGAALGTVAICSLGWFLLAAAGFLLSGGRTLALRFWPTAVVLGIMTASVYWLVKWMG